MLTIHYMRKNGLTLAALVVLAACGSEPSGDGTAPSAPPAEAAPDPASAAAIVLQLGDDVPPAVRERVVMHVSAKRADVKVIAPDADPGTLAAGSLVIAVGTTRVASSLVDDATAAALAPEGFALKSKTEGGTTFVAARGKPGTRLAHGNAGHAYGAYAILEELGFAFLHPLAPTVPARLATPAADLAKKDAPRWPVRGIQLHTMHPLELTHLLEGWGPKGPNDAAGWEAMLPEWDRFLEWSIANGQNRVHWLLLEATSWEDFAQSPVRQARLRRLVDRAHAFGIAVGVDVPIVLQQQHTFRLIKKTGDLESELRQLRDRVDWLMAAGFDYLATENGTTEFTHPAPDRMLTWMNELAKHLDEKHAGAPSYVKIHCSTGQTADGYADPVTGQPINFNFLPHFADKRLGVMPHTVQHYGLDDPAPTYGNTDFGYMHDFLKSEVGEREVVWHPETAYWVSFDVDVPLFLPLYAERRVHDLRILAADENGGRMGRGANAGKRMDGQKTFSSGWEWGYWLNDVVTARAAWNPHDEAASDEAALGAILDASLRAFGPSRAALRDLVIETARVEKRLLIDGEVFGKKPVTVERRNGQAYLQGTETWDDISDLAASIPGIPHAQRTQPDKLGLVDMRVPGFTPTYGEIAPLLGSMEAELDVLDGKWQALRAEIAKSAPHTLDLLDDLRDAMHMTSLRAKQVHGLYDYVDARTDPDVGYRMKRLAAARKALDDAAVVVKAREPRYRVPADRIAGWGNNPTAYEFGYLWTVRSLFFWWRDEGKAVDAPRNPCYLNFIAPADVALGEGPIADAANVLRALMDRPQSTDLGECLGAPQTEPRYPMFGLRSRP